MALKQHISILYQYLKWRSKEFPIWLGIPMLGAFSTHSIDDYTRLLIFFVAICFTAMHILTFNDWSGLKKNPQESARISRPLLPTSLKWLLVLSLGFFAICLSLYAYLNTKLIGLALMGFFVSYLYSSPHTHLKEHVILARVLHLAGGLIQFLLGYLAFSSDLNQGILMGLFFALVFTSGHFFHEAKDYHEDIRADIQTSAVQYGKEIIVILGSSLFFIAHIYFLTLAVLHHIDWLTFFFFFPPVITHSLFLKKLIIKKPITHNDILYYRRQYRLNYALCTIIFICLNGYF